MFFSKKQLKIFNRQKLFHITVAEDEVLALQKTEVINNKTQDDHQVVSSMVFFIYFFCKTFHNSNVSICSNLLGKFPANKIYWGTYLTLVNICTQSYSHNESFGWTFLKPFLKVTAHPGKAGKPEDSLFWKMFPENLEKHTFNLFLLGKPGKIIFDLGL